uniref:FH2 domain-containing protein n=1 Tax=Onchocerca volvulus TaxID=6282 RepID=A0A8R1TLV3_ONCVO
MPSNDGTQRKLSSSSTLQQQAQISSQQQLDTSVDTVGTVSTTSTTPSGLNAEFLHCLTQNLLATTAAGTSGQSQATDAAAGTSVAAAFGLPIPDISMMYNNVNLYNLFNLNLLTESQQIRQQSSSFLTEYLRQRTVEANARQYQQRQQQQQQRQQRPSKEKKRSYPCSFQWCELCLREVHSSKLPCHIRQHHVAQPMFICPQCKFSSSYSKNNVKSHMSTVHGLTEEPISHMEEYADEVEQLMKQCFPTVRGRGRPVHSNIRSSTASSSSTINTESNNNSRRNSASSIASANKISARYTHSYRRRAIKHSAQEMVHELYSAAKSKRVKNENDYKNESEITISQTPIDVSGQSSPSEEDSSGNSNASHNGIKNINYSNGTNNYYNHNRTINCNDHDRTSNYNDEVNSFSRSTGYQNGTDHSETIATGSSPSSSEHVNHDAELETESNDSSMQDFDEEEQPLRHIDRIRPRYLPQNVNWWIVANDQLKGTIFESFRLSEVLHRFPRQSYKLAGKILITEEQLKRVQEVRQQISLDLTKLHDALYSLDLNALPIEQVDLIATIAPTSMDAFYLLDCENADPSAVIGENEQFLLKLAKIDRIEEKLHAMSFMGHINSRVTEILKNFEDLINIVKILRKNRGFRALLRVVLVFMNFIIGDFTANTIRGFRVSDLTKICATEVCNSPKTTLLNIVASSTISEFPEVCIFRDTLPALEKASRVNFQELSATVRRLERDYLRFDREASLLDDKGQMASCREVIRNKVMEVKDSYRECKTGLCKTMRFFGELVDDDIGPELPEMFFANIATFYRQLQRAWIDVHLHGIPVNRPV